MAKCFGVDGRDQGVRQRGYVDVGENQRGRGAGLRGGFVKLGTGDGKKSDDGQGIQTVMELPGGQKLLSGRVAEIEKKGLPRFGFEAAKGVGERRGARNLNRGRWRCQDGLGNL